jgi:putative endopeptidase
MRRFVWILPVLLATGFDAGAGDGPATDKSPKSGIDKTHFDRSVRPQDDLFRHVSGEWLSKSEIPPDRSLDGAFYHLRDQSEAALRAIIQESAAQNDAPLGSETRKVGDLFASFMNESKVEELGLTPIQKDLAEIDAIADKTGLIRTLGRVQKLGSAGIFGLDVDTDAKISDHYIVYLIQGGLGLPDESYYRDDKFRSVREAYLGHVRKMLELGGVADPADSATRILALETRLAKGHWDRVKSRDDTLTYNKMYRKALAELTPGFDWDVWLEALGAKGIDELVVKQPSYFSAMAEALKELPLIDWKDWLKWRVIRTSAPLLSHAFVDEEFAFSGRTLTGAKELRPRWKRGVGVVERALGEAVGKLYVAKHFPAAAKGRMQQLVGNLIEAYRRDIQDLEWMSPETRKKALEKLSKFTPKIGYPDKWRDYSSVEIRRDDLVGNVQRASAFELARTLAKLGKPVDRAEWQMTPQTVNAYYNPGMNEIVFPAAILQPPFFDLEADDAVNYGAIGAVIGHEVGHGFDDQGSKYDGDGNMKNWWSDSDRKEFEVRANRLIAQYNGLEPAQLKGQKVNGALTIGENIGDLGGVTIAFKAYKISLGDTKSAVLDGFTGEQRFFVGWAQVWRAKYRDAELQRRLTIDPHSPAEFRCNGVVRNLREFYEAFGVKEGDKLWIPESQQVRIW